MTVIYDELILLAGGAFVAVWGYSKQAERKKLLSTGIKVEGTIIELKASLGSYNNMTAYYPVIKFETLNKEWVTKQYGFASSTLKYKIGDSVDVIYDTADPEYFIINNKQNRQLGLLLMGVGIVFIIGVIVYFFVNQFPGLQK